MPSLHNASDRHVVIDQRPGQYLCFPDVCLANDGRLIAAYNEFDKHVGARRKLLLKQSRDLGRTWSEPRVLNAADSHCPRLSRLSDGQLLLSDDSDPKLRLSLDHGEHWAGHPMSEVHHGLLDRILELSPETLLTTGHLHRGEHPQPKIRQAPAEQMVYLSEDRGRRWRPLSVMAYDKCLVLCEASMARLPDGRLLALLRENSFVYEPMYACESRDNGRTWSEPWPTPLIGHRPTLGLTGGGKLLVTYRNVGPDAGTAAWLGGVDELRGFAVHGLAQDPANPRLTAEGLLIKNGCGQGSAVRYALRPITDPEHAHAEIQVQVLVREAGGQGCGLRLGRWWRLFPDKLRPDFPDARPVKLRRGEWNTLRVVMDRGECTLFVNGRRRGTHAVEPTAEARAVLFGAVSTKEDNACEALWRGVSLTIREPRYGRDYQWSWTPLQGLPDEYALARVLELKNARGASFADFGYSGWVELPDGRFFCAYHHAEGDGEGYAPGKTSHVAGTWFEASDFGD